MDGRNSFAGLGQLKSRRRKEEIGQQAVDLVTRVRAELERIRAVCGEQDTIARKLEAPGTELQNRLVVVDDQKDAAVLLGGYVCGVMAPLFFGIG